LQTRFAEAVIIYRDTNYFPTIPTIQ